MTDEQDKKMTDMVKSALDKQRNIGIQIGIVATSKVIYEKLTDTSKPLIDRIEAAKKYCRIGLDKEKNLLDKVKNEKVDETADDNK